MSPAETALITKILAGAGVLFVIGYIGNLLSFSNRFVNAFVTAVVFAIIYAGLYYVIDRAMLPEDIRNMSQETWLRMIAYSAALVFVLDLIANMISFSSRLGNAAVTALLFAVLLGVLMYSTGGLPTSLPKPL